MSTPITNIPTTVSYSVGASPSTGPFTIPFAFFSTSDITVYVGSYTALTLGTDYTVSGTMSGGGYPSGGTVTLTASVSSTWVVITRAVPIQRVTQLPVSGKFDIDQLNQDLNVSYAILQQISTAANNALHIPVDDYATAPTTVLPNVAGRASKGLKFDSSGNVTVTTSDPDTMVADSAASAVAAAASASTASTAATTATTQAGVATTQAGLAATAKTAAETAETNAETAQAAAEAARDLAQGYATAADVAKIEWQGAWLTATSYALNDAVSENGSSYICIVAHTSGTFATDLAALKWEVLAAKGTDGAGSGDLLAANNLSDLANASTARTNLGLGTVATLAVDTDTTLAANSDTSIASQKAVKTYVATVPQNSKSAAYTTVLTDMGKHLLHPSADTTARTFTIDSNANVAYPVGAAITFVNQASAGVVTIAITTDTMRLAGAGTTGSRTLAANGIATALKITSTEWIISGTGLT